MRQSLFLLKIKIIHHIIGQAFELVKPIKQFITGALLLVQGQAYAQIHEQAEKQALTIDASTLWTTQQNSKQGFSSSLFSANIDLGLQLNTQQMIKFGIEYSQTPDEQGKAMFALFESSADVLTTQDANEAGRAQVSTFYWQTSAITLDKEPQLILGLIDIEGSIDTNDIANDENTQFLLPSLVNNSSVYTPDYTLGARYTWQASDESVGYLILLSRGQGLADRQGNYADTIFQGNSQIFIASQIHWPFASGRVHFGIWRNQAENAHGYYSAWQRTQEIDFGELGLVARAGFTQQRQDKTVKHSTTSIAFTWRFQNWQTGFGLSSDKKKMRGLINRAHCTEVQQSEFWISYAVTKSLRLSIFNQWQYSGTQDVFANARHSGIRIYWQL